MSGRSMLPIPMLADYCGDGNPVIVQEFVPGRGWRRAGMRKRASGAWLRKLRGEDGTHCYTSFMARGGLAAVRDHGAVPPSYELAGRLDWERFERGLPSVFEWGES